MWYLIVPVLVCLVSYIYHALSRTSGSEFKDNSIEAFILQDEHADDTVPPNKQPHVDKYRTDYVTEGKQVLILFGTEYGLSEEIAKLLFDRILELNGDKDPYSLFQPRLVNARDYQLIDLYKEHVVFIIISTSGDGVPPSDARDFYDFVLKNELELSHLEYSVLALGDSNYPQFCKTGRELDARFLNLGCGNVIPRQDVDMENWSIINSWLKRVCDYLATVTIETKLDYLKLSDVVEEKYNRHHPFMATLKVKKQLTVCTTDTDKETIHCEFDIAGSELSWVSGDALGIYPTNNPPEISRLLDAMHCIGTEIVEWPSFAYTCDNAYEGKKMDLRTVLTHYCDMKTVRTELLCAIRDNVTDTQEMARISELVKDAPNSVFPTYLYDKEVADVLLDFRSHTLSWKQILQCMKSLQPRYYSISSSPKVSSTTVCVTAAVVRYMSHNISRTGVTTTYLQDRLTVGDKCPVFMSCNHDFRLPSNSQSHVILIGPGTGIAPFRAFIQERALETSCGETILYFGCRHRNKDYLYKDELETWASQGTLTLRVAFSRDQTEKVYVQDLLYKDKQYLWKLISKQHAYIYICGDAKHMAHDVHTTFLKIAQVEGHFSGSEAEAYFKKLEQDNRYQKDVWVV